MSVMSRTKAREIALHLIFEMGFQQFEPENLEERLDENIMRSLKTDAEMYAGMLSGENADYIRAVVKGVATHVDELDGAIEFTSGLRARGIVASLGHSEADYDTFELARAAGATHLTHFCNAMMPIHHLRPSSYGTSARVARPFSTLTRSPPSE